MVIASHLLNVGQMLHSRSVSAYARDHVCAETILGWDSSGVYRLIALGVPDGISVDRVREQARPDIHVLDRSIRESQKTLESLMSKDDRTMAPATLCFIRPVRTVDGVTVTTTLVSPSLGIRRHFSSRFTEQSAVSIGDPLSGDDSSEQQNAADADWLAALLPWENYSPTGEGLT